MNKIIDLMNTTQSKLRTEIARAIAGKKYEVREDGIIHLVGAKLDIGGVFHVNHWRQFLVGGVSERRLLEYSSNHNLVVNEGLNHMLEVLVTGGTQIDPWYIGLYQANYTPLATNTAATIAAAATESTTIYDEATRQEYVDGAVSGQSVDNSASKATFTFNGSATIYGAILISNSTKGGTSGTLLCASKFDASKAIADTDTLDIQYSLGVSDS